MTDTPDASAISPLVQFIAAIIFGTGLGISALISRYRASVRPPPSKDFVIGGASIFDMTPMRDLAAEAKRLADRPNESSPQLKRIADALERIVTLMEKRASAEEEERRDDARDDRRFREDYEREQRSRESRRARRAEPKET